jgi:outer membrane biosynthesis protein TonB
VHGSGLTREQLLALHGQATVTVGPDQQVTGFSLTPSGNAAFDAAARAALEAARGQSLPPPPENYPDVAQHQISVTFVCRGNRCD